jgi:adenosylcobyric acid synthase
VLIPGSKATRADLAALRQQGWDIDIVAHHRAGKPVFGLCGGYQMLGRTVADPLGIEGAPGTSEGLGLLEVDTVLEPMKILQVVSGRVLEGGAPVTGYHMHMGVTTGTGRPFAEVNGTSEGSVSADGLVIGTYLHGIFASDTFRSTFLDSVAHPGLDYEAGVDATLDALAAHLERHLDLDLLLTFAAEI